MPVWAYLVAIPVFGVCILVHEMGHYLAARWRRIPVAEFAIGFGPRLFGFQRGETEWSLRAIPLGGYCRWHEEGEGAFMDAPVGSRALVYAAGPLANLLLTWVLLAVLYGVLQDHGIRALWYGVTQTGKLSGLWIGALAGLFRGGIADLMGPVGAAQVTAEAVVAGLDHLVFLAAFLSLNVGLFNLLPLPALDGGRICFLGLERLRRRRLDPYVEGWIHAIGFLALTLLTCATLVKDLLA